MYEIFEKLMKEKGVTAYRVSKDTGVPRATLSEWKKGRYTPKLDKLQLIADYFGVTVGYLMTGEKPEKYYLSDETAQIAQDIFENRELKALFDLASDSTPEDIEAAYSVLLALNKKGK